MTLAGGCGAANWATAPASASMPSAISPASSSSTPWSEWVQLDSIGESVVLQLPAQEAARQQAAHDFACPVAGIVAVQIQPDSAYRVEGCAHRGTFVAVDVYGMTDRAPDHGGINVMSTLRRFILVSQGEPTAALAQLAAHAAELQLRVNGSTQPVQVGDDERSAIGPWIDLSRAAARDLPCPQESIALDVVSNARAPSTFLAVGCGLRGTFVRDSSRALVITARVSLAGAASPAP